MVIHGKNGYCPLAAVIKERGHGSAIICGWRYAIRILDIPFDVAYGIADGFDGYQLNQYDNEQAFEIGKRLAQKY